MFCAFPSSRCLGQHSSGSHPAQGGKRPPGQTPPHRFGLMRDGEAVQAQPNASLARGLSNPRLAVGGSRGRSPPHVVALNTAGWNRCIESQVAPSERQAPRSRPGPRSDGFLPGLHPWCGYTHWAMICARAARNALPSLNLSAFHATKPGRWVTILRVRLGRAATCSVAGLSVLGLRNPRFSLQCLRVSLTLETGVRVRQVTWARIRRMV